VKLLFDQNLSHRLVAMLASMFPDSSHVRQFGLQSETDEVIWDFAREHGFTLVSKDAEFHQRSFLYGFPPKIIWVRLGNCSTRDVASILQHHEANIRRFCADEFHAFLAIP
jgi:predicted nuclease of predicted toxin-antitoxin system